MNRKALLGLTLALLVPIAAYLVMKNKSGEVTAQPPHFLPDSVISYTKDGKDYTDTVWHKIPDFNLTNQAADR
jgi:protein SCO1